jgi:hypothetical protein
MNIGGLRTRMQSDPFTYSSAAIVIVTFVSNFIPEKFLIFLSR